MFDFSYKQHTTASKNSFKRDIQVLKTMIDIIINV